MQEAGAWPCLTPSDASSVCEPVLPVQLSQAAEGNGLKTVSPAEVQQCLHQGQRSVTSRRMNVLRLVRILEAADPKNVPMWADPTWVLLVTGIFLPAGVFEVSDGVNGSCSGNHSHTHQQAASCSVCLCRDCFLWSVAAKVKANIDRFPPKIFEYSI